MPNPNLHMEILSDLEIAQVVDQGLASLNARFEDRDTIRETYPDLSGLDLAELASRMREACDSWDRLADELPGFREV